METKTEIVNRTFDCPKCERRVTFRVSQTSYRSDEGLSLGKPEVERILDYGSCVVARNAKIPGYPIQPEMDHCPFDQALG